MSNPRRIQPGGGGRGFPTNNRSFFFQKKRKKKKLSFEKIAKETAIAKTQN
jgi:hypothetical protein